MVAGNGHRFVSWKDQLSGRYLRACFLGFFPLVLMTPVSGLPPLPLCLPPLFALTGLRNLRASLPVIFEIYPGCLLFAGLV